jgi:hypothetical protein
MNDILLIRELLLCGRKIQVGNGERPNFWGDAWCGFSPLKDKFQNYLRYAMSKVIQL